MPDKIKLPSAMSDPILIPLDAVQPTEPGIYVMRRPHDESPQWVRVRPGNCAATVLWVHWMSGDGCCPMERFPPARWSRRIVPDPVDNVPDPVDKLPE